LTKPTGISSFVRQLPSIYIVSGKKWGFWASVKAVAELRGYPRSSANGTVRKSEMCEVLGIMGFGD
jgi:hypothetical protein